MYFFLARPLVDAVIIEANFIEELIFQVSTYGEFYDEDLEKVFSQKRRDRFVSNDDKSCDIMRLTNREYKSVSTKVCPKCVENNDTRYISDDAPMCDFHLLAEYNLEVTHDATDCFGMIDLLYADEVIKILRRLDDKK